MVKNTVDITDFTVFYRRHYNLALTIAQQRLAGWSDAEDVTAEAFRIAWAHHHEGMPLSLPWLYRVVRNLIGNEYRRLSRTDSFTHAIEPLIEEQAAELSSGDALEMRSCMQRLPEDARELLYMAYWEGLSGSEMAEILGCSDLAVRTRLMRARQKVKKLLTHVGNTTAQEVKADDGRD